MPRVIGSEEPDQFIEKFIDALKNYKDKYYTQKIALAHVSEVSHMCPLYMQLSWRHKQEKGEMLPLYDLQDWYLFIGTLLHKGLEHYVTEEMLKNMDVAKIEKEVMILFNIMQDRPAKPDDPINELLVGRCDLIITLKDGTQILIDYKTTRRKGSSGFKQSYLNQLTLYAYCLNRSGYNIKYAYIIYFNLLNDQIIQNKVDVNETYAKEHIKYVKEFYMAEKEGRKAEARISTQCFYCPAQIKNQCEKYWGQKQQGRGPDAFSE